MKRLKNRIKEERLKQGFSQKKLADLIGTSQQQIDLLEKDERKVSLEWLDKISKGLGISPIALLPMEWDVPPRESRIDKELLGDIMIAVNDIISGNALTAREKAKLVLILYEEYESQPQNDRMEKIIEFSKLFLKTKTA